MHITPSSTGRHWLTDSELEKIRAACSAFVGQRFRVTVITDANMRYVRLDYAGREPNSGDGFTLGRDGKGGYSVDNCEAEKGVKTWPSVASLDEALKQIEAFGEQP